MYDKRVKFFYNLLDIFFSIVRLICKTHFIRTTKIDKRKKECIIMGNGPSLRQLLKKYEDSIRDYDLIAVNFMGLYPEFSTYKPEIYVLCDPAFWFSKDVDKTILKKVQDFYKHLALTVSWHIQLYIPYEAKKVVEIHKILSSNTYIRIKYFNKTKFEGFSKINYWIYDRQWGVPRLENVMIAALMLAIYSQYRKIFLAGVENDWMRNLGVDEKNRLYIKQTHFYTDGNEQNCQFLSHLKMHEICLSLSFAFKGYIEIEKYARKCSIAIYNLNKDSFIDAFIKTAIIKKTGNDTK
ncbi:MAG: hypothetical protein PHG27_00115 [Massilibacteroides sp.]|nr:hypothetical protein [Massilibacteroides sp.]MDD3062270.1 hypothetical protein [Massilibacteroides sp.]MDD4113991.1 hypothetical protein [Massilibacteroides sp.]MDD4660043.1 hypothetical protein [Massilibacteroides sp.]